MYWGDAHQDKIESARIDGTGRRVVGTERRAHYFAFLLRDGDIYITDWTYMYVRCIVRPLEGFRFCSATFLTSTPCFRKKHPLILLAIS